MRGRVWQRQTPVRDVAVLKDGKTAADIICGIGELKRFQMQRHGDAPLQVSNGNAGFGNFFKYHGWLSPGVRLFRSIRFQAKGL